MKHLRSLPAVEVGIVVAVLACLIFLGLLGQAGRQRAAQSYDSYSTFDYRPGGYRAWSDLLRTEGVSVQPFERRPAFLNDGVDVLIVANNASDALALAQAGKSVGMFAPADYAQLRRWVVAGGRLVWLVDASATDQGVNPSRMLSGKSASDESSALGLPPIALTRAHSERSLSVLPSDFTTGVRTIAVRSPLRIARDSFTVTPLAVDSAGVLAGWYRLGKGSVVAIADESLFQNSRLKLADNARLAYDIAAAGVRPGATVAFDEWSHGFESGDTWWTILPRNVRWALTLAAGIIALWLAGGLLRFGPPIQPASGGERTSAEYLTSVAWLMQRGNAARKAVRDLAELCRHEMAHAFGLPPAATAAAVALRLRGGTRGDQDAADLMELDRISGYEQPSPSELVRAAAICISLRKEYGQHGHSRLCDRRPHQRRSA